MFYFADSWYKGGASLVFCNARHLFDNSSWHRRPFKHNAGPTIMLNQQQSIFLCGICVRFLRAHGDHGH